MNENQPSDDQAPMYDREAELYEQFGDDSFSWKFVERKAFDLLVPEFYNPESRILELGCGYGRVLQHLVERGVSPSNLTGIDVSHKMLEAARQRVPETTLIQASAEDFDLEEKNFDLIVANMMTHYLDRQQLRQSLEQIYQHLADDGVFFFIATHPERMEQVYGGAVDRWAQPATPWGTTTPFYCHDFHRILNHDIYYAGFDYEVGDGISPDPETAEIDPDKYANYSRTPARIAVRMRKVEDERKARRQSYID